VKLTDYQGRVIELSEDSWAHIQEAHPEISLEELKAVLVDPTEVRQCPRQSFVELVYQSKEHFKGKPRFRVVVVKVLKTGNFISTAMTASTMKPGKVLYKKEKTK
jgi:hypothetical protein